MSLFKKALLSIANTKDRIQETFSKISFKNNLSIEQIDSIEECLLSSDISWNLTKKIVNQGFTVSSSKSDADLVCIINADTKKGTENSGVFVSYMTVSFFIKNKKTQKVIYTTKLIDVKGVQLDYEKAGEDAYKKSFKKIDKKILPEMQEVVFE